MKLYLLLAILPGILLGTGAFTFFYAEGFSYFSTDPRACVNCHIMRDQYDSWQHSSHHAVSGCVDCHLPHELVPKFIAKGVNGWNHSVAFTLQNFPEPIRIGRRNAQILQDNCVHCHKPLVHQMFTENVKADEDLRCVRCHKDVGHGPRS